MRKWKAQSKTAEGEAVQRTDLSNTITRNHLQVPSQSYESQSFSAHSNSKANKGDSSKPSNHIRSPASQTRKERLDSRPNTNESGKRTGKRRLLSVHPSPPASNIKTRHSIKLNMNNADLPDIQSEYVSSAPVYQFHNPAEKTFYDVTAHPKGVI